MSSLHHMYFCTTCRKNRRRTEWCGCCLLLTWFCGENTLWCWSSIT